MHSRPRRLAEGLEQLRWSAIHQHVTLYCTCDLNLMYIMYYVDIIKIVIGIPIKIFLFYVRYLRYKPEQQNNTQLTLFLYVFYP